MIRRNFVEVCKLCMNFNLVSLFVFEQQLN